VMPALDDGPLRVSARVELAAIRADEPRVSVELLEAALADVGEDDRWRVKIESGLTAVATTIGRLAVARSHAGSAVRAAERSGDPDLVAMALGQLLVTFVTTGSRCPMTCSRGCPQWRIPPLRPRTTSRVPRSGWRCTGPVICRRPGRASSGQ